MSEVLGVLLAAGGGRRMGTPKGLLVDADGVPFVERAVTVLREGGCHDVLVVLGAAATQVQQLVPAGVTIVVAEDWATGMGASLRSGLTAALETEAASALVTLVDLPDVGARVVRRVCAQGNAGPGALARAAYDGVPGHPVLIGRVHWPEVTAAAEGDKGARDYLMVNQPLLIECGDLATGRDVDRPEDL